MSSTGTQPQQQIQNVGQMVEELRSVQSNPNLTQSQRQAVGYAIMFLSDSQIQNSIQNNQNLTKTFQGSSQSGQQSYSKPQTTSS